MGRPLDPEVLRGDADDNSGGGRGGDGDSVAVSVESGVDSVDEGIIDATEMSTLMELAGRAWRMLEVRESDI